MSGSVNKVIIVGNLGRDPEVRTFQNGGRVCNLAVATSESWKDKQSGEKKERTEWHKVTIYNDHLVDLAEKFLKKGSKVFLEGQLETRKFTDQAGVEKYTTEVVLRPFRGEMTLLDGVPVRGEAAGPATTPSSRPMPNRPAGDGTPRYGAQNPPPRKTILDDEIPF